MNLYFFKAELYAEHGLNTPNNFIGDLGDATKGIYLYLIYFIFLYIFNLSFYYPGIYQYIFRQVSLP